MMGESAHVIVARAVAEARGRDHSVLGNEHIFLAFAQVEWDMFAQVMRDLELNPHAVLQSLEEHLNVVPAVAGRDLRVSPAAKLVFKLALHHASRCLAWCEANPGALEDWDLPYAHEALARAHALAGDADQAAAHAAEARELATRVAGAEDREHLEEDLATLS